ncbi:MAG: TIR domain-containing protein [Propionibacteriales bacterium]|nr:TIR domain-containing protein [Propionibacteriales bacterium]
MPYDAFISYSHAADDALAPAVQRALQTLARPWNRRRALEVFRDQTGLAVSPGLWTSICTGLDDSTYFVLMASPEAAASTWVNQEIDHWSASHSIDRLLPVLTAGDWIWDPHRGDFDWERSTAVPDALRGKFREEPRHLDLRWARTETELDLRHSKFREAMAQLAAPMHNLSPQDLESSDVARFRHLVRLRRAVVAVLCIMLALVSVAGVLAVKNADQAREQQALAEQQQALAEQKARLALSLQLLAQAKVIGSHQKTLSLLLTAEAARLDPTEAWSSLVTGLQDSPGLNKVYDLPGGARANSTSSALDPGTKLYASVTHQAALRPVIQLWDLDSGRQSGKLVDKPLYGLSATELAFGPKARLAARYRCLKSLCDKDPGGIQLWDVATRKGRLLPGSAGYSTLTFSRAGDRLAASAPDGTVRVWDAASRELQASIHPKGAGVPTGLAFSADGKMLALALKDLGRIVSWDTSRPTLSDPVSIFFPRDEFPEQIAFGSGAVLASRVSNGEVQLWSANSGKPLGQLEPPSGSVVSLASGPAGTLATASANGSLRLWDLEGRQQDGPAQPSGSRGTGVTVMFDQRGALVSAGSDIRFWDVTGWGQSGKELYHHDSAVTALAVSSDAILASGDGRGVIRLWDLPQNRLSSQSLRGHHGAVTALAFNADGVLASGGQDGTVRLWDTATGEELRKPFESHDGTVTSLAFSADGGTLAAGYDKGTHPTWHRRDPIHVWDVTTGSLVQRLQPGLQGGVASVAFSSGSLFASAGADYLASWPVDTWLSKKLVEDPRWGPYTAVAFSADGKTLASSADRFAAGDARTVVLWRMPSGDQSGEPLDAGRSHTKVGSFRALSFSPDGTLLAGAGDGGAQLWDVTRHQPLGGRLGSSPTSSIAVSPDGLLVIAGDAEGFVRAYPATIDGWLRSVCDVVSRNLTQREWESFVGSATPYAKTCPQYPGT